MQVLRQDGIGIGAVIPVQVVDCPGIRPADDGEGAVVQGFGALTPGAQEQGMVLLQEQGKFPQAEINPVVAPIQRNEIVILRRTEADHQHILRQVNIAA